DAGVEQRDVAALLAAEELDRSRFAKGVEEDVGIVRVEQLLEPVLPPLDATGTREDRVDVVVADDGATAGFAPEAKDLGGFGPRVDEIAARPQLVGGGVEADELQEIVQL